MSAGVGQTMMPAAVMAAILSSALPLPPEMMAPAWPMRRPGGAVCPAMKPITGFFTCSFIYAAASLFGVAADFADHDDGVGVGVFVEELDGVGVGGADDGVAADADAGGLADFQVRQLAHRFISQRAGAGDYAHVAGQMNVRRA